ncbi:O-methyltransferase MdmC [Smittium mucronatum]|uniref:O-methyltransferase MdmC n=1 Tax=Smittium mucronatum TaxID=133383 RepID=A0A1R0H859_9FUNG|nr:O-methyltransferase MdmC [Smittium mucronatum]
MMISPTQGQAMSMLISAIRPNRVLELGCFVGNSALWIADGLSNVPEKKGHLWTCEIDPKMAAFATKNVEMVSDLVTVVNSSAQDFLDSWNEKNQFDFIFIDADKGGYINYYETILSRNMLSLSGLIVADNVLFKDQVHPIDNRLGGMIKAPKSIREKVYNFNLHVSLDNRTEQVILPIFDGLSIIRLKRN